MSGRFGVVLSWFWEALSHMSTEDMARFVQFCTGTYVLNCFLYLGTYRTYFVKTCIERSFQKQTRNFVLFFEFGTYLPNYITVPYCIVSYLVVGRYPLLLNLGGFCYVTYISKDCASYLITTFKLIQFRSRITCFKQNSYGNTTNYFDPALNLRQRCIHLTNYNY